MHDFTIFYLVFLSQIVLVSYYYPGKLLKRMNIVIDSYPPSEYPKLYPESVDLVQNRQQNYLRMNQAALVLGIILLIGHGTLSSRDATLLSRTEALPFLFGMIQFSPLIFMELSGFKQLKLMRLANKRPARTAKLMPRRLFDFISPKIVSIALIAFVAYLLLEFSYPTFQFRWHSDGIIRASSLIVSNLLLGGLIIWNLSGKKLNPHQAHDDRIRQIEFAVNSLFFVSIAATVFFIVTVVIDELNSDYLEIVVNSIYFQIIAMSSIGYMVRTIRIEEMDFEVYKANV